MQQTDEGSVDVNDGLFTSFLGTTGDSRDLLESPTDKSDTCYLSDKRGVRKIAYNATNAYSRRK